MGKKEKLGGKRVNPKKIAPAPKRRKEPVKRLSYKTGTTTSRIKRYTKTIKKRK